jgi:hypothetical protein
MHINVINVTYTYIMLHTIKPTYLMTVYCLCGAAPNGLSFEKITFFPPDPLFMGGSDYD